MVAWAEDPLRVGVCSLLLLQVKETNSEAAVVVLYDFPAGNSSTMQLLMLPPSNGE